MVLLLKDELLLLSLKSRGPLEIGVIVVVGPSRRWALAVVGTPDCVRVLLNREDAGCGRTCLGIISQKYFLQILARFIPIRALPGLSAYAHVCVRTVGGTYHHVSVAWTELDLVYLVAWLVYTNISLLSVPRDDNSAAWTLQNSQMRFPCWPR